MQRERRSPSTTPVLDDTGMHECASMRDRRSSESAVAERSVVWESHGMCVVEDGGGSISIEPRMVYSAKVAYGRIVRAFIRPPRAEYELAALGPRIFSMDSRTFLRRDKETRNVRGRLVRYSIWREVSLPASRRGLEASGMGYRRAEAALVEESFNRECRPRATIMYAHGNASSRVEGLSQLALTLSLGRGVQFVALDCCGSGRSEGEFVSLGFKEQEDVVAVLEAERAAGGVGRVVLWGRSMGAVTALLVAASREPDVAAIVCDSAYSSLRELALDVAKRGAASLPAFVARSALRWIRNSVLKRADFDIFDVDALKHVPECVAPAFFVCAADDTFVEPSHTSRLFEAIASHSKELCVCAGSHNSTRPKECFDRVEAFLRGVLGLQPLSNVASCLDSSASSQSPTSHTPLACTLDQPALHTPGNEDEEPGASRRPFASALDEELLPIIPESRRADRPNFAALAPWTIEDLRVKSREVSFCEDVLPSPRWLHEERGEDAVEAMYDALCPKPRIAYLSQFSQADLHARRG